MPHHDSAWDLLCLWAKQNWGWFAAWLGTLTLAQMQAVVGIASGLAMLVYTLVRTFYLVRGKRSRGDE